MQHAFGSGPAFTVGAEEEVFLVDPATRELVHDAERIVAAMGLPKELGGHEAPASQVELRSLPRRTANEAATDLAHGRAAARAAGATLIGAGLHPTAPRDQVRLVDTERYRKVLEEMRGLILRAAEAALHVHVGMPDAAAAIRSFNALRGWLPLFRGLAASSPFWFGRDSGLASARWALIRPYPGRGIPRPLRDLAEYEEVLAHAHRGGGPDDYTLIWWDVRLHPAHGTVEVREMDGQSRLTDVAALSALIQGLARHHAEAATDAVPSDAIEWSAFRAARDGLGAEILLGDRLVPLPEAARTAVELAMPHARESGSEDALAGIERILGDGNGAVRQRRSFESGGMDAVLERLVDETAQPLL
jgi:glutamate---cysteine ligase / carboxylate-amine ligase